MGSSSYGSFIRLLEKWPLDPTKKGKDVGEALRQGSVRVFCSGLPSEYQFYINLIYFLCSGPIFLIGHWAALLILNKLE
jgi:hypothetical protein